MNKKLLIKILIIGIPTYTVALITKAMVFTMPMLAITTVIDGDNNAVEVTTDAQLVKFESLVQLIQLVICWQSWQE